jgi:hypothetical protein
MLHKEFFLFERINMARTIEVECINKNRTAFCTSNHDQVFFFFGGGGVLS